MWPEILIDSICLSACQNCWSLKEQNINCSLIIQLVADTNCTDSSHKQSFFNVPPFAAGLSLSLAASLLFIWVTHRSVELGLVSQLSTLSSFPQQRLNLGKILAPVESFILRGVPLIWRAAGRCTLTYGHKCVQTNISDPYCVWLCAYVLICECVSMSQKHRHFAAFGLLVNMTWLLSLCAFSVGRSLTNNKSAFSSTAYVNCSGKRNAVLTTKTENVFLKW